jgi:DNA-binding MarR family transcriptional regulator
MSSRRASPEEALIKLAKELDQHLGVIRQKLREPLEAEFARGELTGPQRMVMQALVRSQGLSSVSGIVDRLQARGMVVRQRDETDGRATVIVPSSEVRDFLSNRMPQLIISPLTKALEGASDKDRAIVLRGFRKMRALIERSRPQEKAQI